MKHLGSCQATVLWFIEHHGHATSTEVANLYPKAYWGKTYMGARGILGRLVELGLVQFKYAEAEATDEERAAFEAHPKAATIWFPVKEG